MIEDDFWKSWWAVILIGGPIVMSFILIAHGLYISRHLPIMLKALKNSSYIVTYQRLSLGFDVPGRVFLVSQIAGMVIWPRHGIRAGLMSAEDIKNFPPRLLYSLKVNTAILGIVFVWGVVAYAAVQLR